MSPADESRIIEMAWEDPAIWNVGARCYPVHAQLSQARQLQAVAGKGVWPGHQTPEAEKPGCEPGLLFYTVQAALGNQAPVFYPSRFRTRCASIEKSKSFPLGRSKSNSDTAIGTRDASRNDSSR